MSYLLHRAKLLRVTSSSTWRGVTSLPVKTLNCHISRTRHTSIPVFVLNWDQVTSILYTKNRAISSTETWRIWPLFVPFDPTAAAVSFFPCPTVLTWNDSDICWYPYSWLQTSTPLPWCDILFTIVIWHNFHYRDVTYFSLPWCNILFSAVMWHTFHYRDVTYFQLPWSDILSNTVMWHTFKYRDVTYFSLLWCDILFTTVVWHTFNYLDVTHSPLPWCDILSTSVMWHTFHYRDATYFQLLGCDILSTAVIWHTAGNQFFFLVEMTTTVP